VFVDLTKLETETLAMRQYVYHVEILCVISIIRNWTGCAHFSVDARDRLNQLTKTKMLREIKGRRSRKRGVFNFVGEVSKVLFGTMDDDDAKFYNKQIKMFEQNS
jgi:hypothetical protein